jgi:Mrp family chromosome partitioning ATPase
VAIEYDNYRRATARAAISESVSAGRKRLRQLERSGASAAERRALRNRLIELRTSSAVGVDAPQVIRRAEIPRAPTAPSKLVALASILLGILLAAGAALLVDLIDKRLLRPEDVESAFGAPVMLDLSSRGRGHRGAGGDDGEAYASLAARLATAAPDDSPGVLMVSAAGPRDLSAEVAKGLASQLAALGRVVVHIEATLRRSPVPSNGEAEPPHGLSAVLQGLTAFSDELVPERRPAGGGGVRSENGDAKGWMVLPRGAPVPNPGLLLGRSELSSAVEQARASADFVLVEAPYAGRDDAFPVAALCDGILLVAEAAGTTRDDSDRVRHALGRLYSKVFGLVLFAGGPQPPWRVPPGAWPGVPARQRAAEPEERPTTAATQHGWLAALLAGRAHGGVGVRRGG